MKWLLMSLMKRTLIQMHYVFATQNGMIKKSTVPLFKTTRFNKPLIATNFKENDDLISVMRFEKDELITVITNKGMSLTYNTSELSDTGLRREWF